MRVLHLPHNIASIPSSTILALRDIGVDARGIAAGSGVIQSMDGFRVYPFTKRNPIKKLQFWAVFLKEIAKADIVHWYFTELSARGLELDLVRRLGKPAVVEWLGSDIRNPEVEFADNPYYQRAYNTPGFECRNESTYASRARQLLFSSAGFIPIISKMTGMKQYLDCEIFPRYYDVAQRLYLPLFKPVYPGPSNKKVKVVHAPSAPITKGTEYVLDAVKRVKRVVDFDFVLLRDMPRDQALCCVREADIFLDQFVLGLYGMAAIEAMAFGKPVICYMKPSLASQFPTDNPVVSSSAEELSDKLEYLICDGDARARIGREGRKYVEKYHCAEKIAVQLSQIYSEIISEHFTSNPR